MHHARPTVPPFRVQLPVMLELHVVVLRCVFSWASFMARGFGVGAGKLFVTSHFHRVSPLVARETRGRQQEAASAVTRALSLAAKRTTPCFQRTLMAWSPKETCFCETLRSPQLRIALVETASVCLQSSTTSRCFASARMPLRMCLAFSAWYLMCFPPSPPLRSIGALLA